MRTLALLVLVPGLAFAQQPPPAASEGSVMSTPSGGGSRRDMANDWMIPPAGDLVFGTSVTYVTAASDLYGRELKFTDLVLVGLSAHYSIKGRVELSAGTTLLPKKPEWSDENVWQGGGLGARIGFGKRWAAYLRGAGGPMVDQAGWWYAGAAGFQARKSIHETIVFQGSVGGLGSRLDFDGPGNKAWLVEIGATGEIIFRTPHNEVALWLGSQFHFPVGSGPDDAIDPETRVSFHMGTVLAYVPKWDIVFELVFNDRGDVMEPGSTLPVLDGGFDQTQLTFSIARRFGKDEYGRKDREIHIAR